MLSALKNLTQQRKTRATSVLDVPDLVLQADKIANTLYGGMHGRKKSGIGERFWQFKPYEKGDDIRRIDWRQSAKRDQIFIRQKEWESAQRAVFWVDKSPNMNYESKTHNASLIALSLMRAIMRGGENVSLLNRPDLSAGHSNTHFQKLSGSLISSDAYKSDERIPNNITLILISDFLDPIGEISQKLRRYASKADRILCIQILDESEITLPFKGRTIFTDMSDRKNQDIESISKIREAYKQKLDDHLNAFHRLCSALKAQHILYRSDQDILTAIHKAWHALAGV